MEALEPPGYKYFRDEIKREDEITHHRMTVCLSFQAFLFAGVGFLVYGSWPSGLEKYDLLNIQSAVRVTALDNVASIEMFRISVIGGLGIVGYVLSAIAFVGILATRISINSVERQFINLFGETDDPNLIAFY